MLSKSIILIKNRVIHHSYRYTLTHTHAHSPRRCGRPHSSIRWRSIGKHLRLFIWSSGKKKKKEKSMQHIWLYMCHSVFRTRSAALAQTHSMHGARLFVEPILVFGLVNMRNTLPSVMFCRSLWLQRDTFIIWRHYFSCSGAAWRLKIA